MKKIASLEVRCSTGGVKKIYFHIKDRSRGLNIRVSLYSNGACIVSKSRRISYARTEQFLQERGQWLIDKVDFTKNHEWSRNLLAEPAKKAKEREEYLTLKDEALRIARERLLYFNQYYKYQIGTISIRNQTSRWGSCSKKGNLNFNYRIAKLPTHLVDYLVVHELCHIGQFDHSQKFWHLVSMILPNYKILRKELKAIRL